jgi:hypothetical protein
VLFRSDSPAGWRPHDRLIRGVQCSHPRSAERLPNGSECRRSTTTGIGGGTSPQPKRGFFSLANWVERERSQPRPIAPTNDASSATQALFKYHPAVVARKAPRQAAHRFAASGLTPAAEVEQSAEFAWPHNGRSKIDRRLRRRPNGQPILSSRLRRRRTFRDL